LGKQDPIWAKIFCIHKNMYSRTLMLSDNFTAGFFVSFIMTVFVPDIEGFQNKVG